MFNLIKDASIIVLKTLEDVQNVTICVGILYLEFTHKFILAWGTETLFTVCVKCFKFTKYFFCSIAKYF